MATQPPPETQPPAAPIGEPMTSPTEVSPPQHDVDVPDPSPPAFPAPGAE